MHGELNAFNAALPAPQGAAAPFSFTTLGLRAINFETFEGLVDIGGYTASFENVILGSNSGDTITLDEVSGGVAGNPPPSGFNDLIFGFNGNDVINGEGGNDVIIGSSGNDTLNGGDGDDVFLYSGSNNGADTVSGDGGSDAIVITDDNTDVGLKRFLKTVLKPLTRWARRDRASWVRPAAMSSISPMWLWSISQPISRSMRQPAMTR